MAILLGLDSSTATTGWAFVDTDTKEILDAGFIKTDKIKGRYDKVTHIQGVLRANPLMSQTAKVLVEASLMNVQGKTSKQTIIMLAKHNAVLCFVLEQEFGIPVDDVDPNVVRKTLWGVSRVKGFTSKQLVAIKVKANYNVDPWIKMNTRGTPDKCNEDMFDAIIMAYYGIYTHK